MSHISLRVHFMHRHMQEMVVILEEGSHPLLICTKCDMFITWRVINVKHQATAICDMGEERRRKRRQLEEVWRSTAVDFQAYESPLEEVHEFK